MAKTITLIDGNSYIEIQFAAGHKITIPKAGLGTKIKDGMVILFWNGDMSNKVVRPYKELDYREILSPTVASAAALRTLILSWLETEFPPTLMGGGGESAYIGKLYHGDFIASYGSATTIMLGVVPAYLTGDTGAEATPATWEAVTDASFRITVDGTAVNVDAIDFTGDASMAEVAATIQAALRTATSGLETVEWDTDHFIISSVLYEPTSEVSVTATSTGVVGTDISGAGVDDWMDSDTANGVETLVRGGYPPGVTGFRDEDIEFVRQIATDGTVTALYERSDVGMSIAGHILTVSGAAFISTDTFVIGTNIPRGSVDDIIRAAGSFYIGKATNADFVTAYASGTTIDFTDLPSDITNITGDDIEIVKQINTANAVVKTFTRDDTVMSVAANTLTVTDASFLATDKFIIYTNIPRTSGGGGGGIDSDYKIGSWDGTVTYASTTTVTLAGSYPTINSDNQIIYIKVTDSTLETAEIFRNGINGVYIKHSAGTLTIYGAGTPLAATGTFEVGLSATPISKDIGSDTTKTTEQAPDYGHFTDSEHISESDLGIDGTHDGGASATVFNDSSETYTAESVAEGYLIYNVTDAQSAIISSGGAGSPTADDITHAALGGAAQWAATEVASIPEVKRFEIDASSYTLMSIHAKITAGAANKVFMKVYGSNNSSADTTDDTNWVDLSTDILGAGDINATAGNTTEGLYIVDTPSVLLKYMIKIIAECSDGVQDNDYDIYVKKGY